MSLSKEEIIRMAREAGFDVSEYTGGKLAGKVSVFDYADVDIFIEAARLANAAYAAGASAERKMLSKIRAPKPRDLPQVGTGALLSEQRFCFAEGYREGAAAIRKAIRARGNGGEK